MIISTIVACLALVADRGDRVFLRVRSIEQIEGLDLGRARWQDAAAVARRVAERWGFPASSWYGFAPVEVEFDRRFDPVSFAFEIGPESRRVLVSYFRSSGQIRAVGLRDARPPESPAATVDEATATADALASMLPTPYPLVRTLVDPNFEPDKVYIEYRMTVPGVDPPLFAVSSASVPLSPGGSISLHVGYPPVPTPLAGPPLSLERLGAIAVGAVAGVSGWRETVAFPQPVVWEVPAYRGYPNALTEADDALARSGRALIVSMVYVADAGSYSVERRQYTREALVWVQADTGRVLALAPVGMYEGGSGPPTEGRRAPFSLSGLWRSGGASGRLERVAAAPMGPTRRVALSQGARWLVGDWEPSSGLLRLRSEGRTLYLRPSGSLREALDRAPEVPEVRLAPPR